VHGDAELYLKSDKFLGDLSKPSSAQKDPSAKTFKVVAVGNNSADKGFKIENHLLKTLKA
jgi:hypothetical protein